MKTRLPLLVGALLLFLATTANAQTITTDKDDYAPGEMVTITGTGWQPGEVVHMILHEDPAVEHEHELGSLADAEGNFVNTDFAPDESHLGTTFTLVATGESSGLEATTVFTDGNPVNIRMVADQDPLPVSAGDVASYTVDVLYEGTDADCPVTLAVTPSGTDPWPDPLPAGFFQLEDNPLVGGKGDSPSTRLFVDTTPEMPTGTYAFTVSGTPADTKDCQGNSPSSLQVDLIVEGSPSKESTSISNVTGTATYGGTATLMATLTDANHARLEGKTIQFSLAGDLICGATGLSDCPTTDADGTATLTGVNISDYDAGSYEDEVTAAFTEDDDYLGSSASGNLDIYKAGTTLSDVSGSGVFGDTAVLTATLKSGEEGLEGMTIQFSLDNELVCGGTTGVTCPVTNVDGVATLTNVDVSEYTTAGEFTDHVTASFAGDTNYEATSNVTGGLTLADETAPEVPALTVEPNPAGDETVTITATVSDALTGGSDVTAVYYTLNGGTAVAFTGLTPDVTLTDVTATFSTTALSDGDNDVCVYGVDAESNSGGDDPRCETLVVDKSAPVVANVMVSPGRITGGDELTLSGEVKDDYSSIAAIIYEVNEDGDLVKLDFEDKDATIEPINGDPKHVTFSTLIPTATLGHGEYTVCVVANDALGNEGTVVNEDEQCADFFVDNIGPLVEGLDVGSDVIPPSGSVTATASIDDSGEEGELGGSNVASATWVVTNEADATVASGTETYDGNQIVENFSVTINAPSGGWPGGAYDVCVTGTDEFGNVGSEDCTSFNVDAVPPSVDFVKTVDADGNDNDRIGRTDDLYLEGTADDALSAIKMIWYKVGEDGSDLGDRDNSWEDVPEDDLLDDAEYGTDGTITFRTKLATDLDHGGYKVCVVASDQWNQEGSVEDDACATFSVDDRGPLVEGLAVDSDVIPPSGSVTTSASIDDSGEQGGSNVASASWVVTNASDETVASDTETYDVDEVVESFSVTIDAPSGGWPGGSYSVCVTGTDEFGNEGDKSCRSFDVDALPPAVATVKTVDAEGDDKDRIGKGHDLYLEGTAEDALSAIKMIWYKVGEEDSDLGERDDESWEEVPEGDLLDSADYGADGTITFRTQLNTELEHGGYKVCVVASDQWDQEGSAEDAPCATFFVDNQEPVISNVVVNPFPVYINAEDVALTATIDDRDDNDPDGGSTVKSASFKIFTGECTDLDNEGCNEVGAGSLDPAEGSEFGKEHLLNVTAILEPFVEAGTFLACVYGTDEVGNVGGPECAFLPVVDPTAGFVTGGGWIDSPEEACTLEGPCVDDDGNPVGLTGKANFGFVSKYEKNGKAKSSDEELQLTGNTQFQFKAGNLNFHSNAYEWLVINGHKAQYKGTGTINGEGPYGFMITAIDANMTESGETDQFRIKIWVEGTDNVVYDNQRGESDVSEKATSLGGGSIVIHSPSQKVAGNSGKGKGMMADGSFGGTAEVPSDFGLDQNYPNPFNPSTQIKFGLPTDADVRVEVYDMLGRRVAELGNGPMKAGYHTVSFDASHLSSGVYVYHMAARGEDGGMFEKTNTMVLMK